MGDKLITAICITLATIIKARIFHTECSLKSLIFPSNQNPFHQYHHLRMAHAFITLALIMDQYYAEILLIQA